MANVSRRNASEQDENGSSPHVWQPLNIPVKKKVLKPPTYFLKPKACGDRSVREPSRDQKDTFTPELKSSLLT